MSFSPPLMTDERIAFAAERLMNRCNMLAQHSEHAYQLTRTFCSEPMKRVHDDLRTWIGEIGWTTRLDAAGNLIGSKTDKSERPVLLLGSHLDTVKNAGKFDGALGVLMGLAAIELLEDSNLTTNFDIELIGFSEEEGVRFNKPYLGSSAVAGCFDGTDLELCDREGFSVCQLLEAFGCEPNSIESASYANRNLVGYVEVHIEQGPVLESSDCSVGIVSAIAGQTRATVSFEGRAGHAGTVPLRLRRDALAGAAEFIIAVENLGLNMEGLFATVGEILVEPNVSNVIPEKVRLHLDLRHASDDERHAAFGQLVESANNIANNRKLDVAIEKNLEQTAVNMDSTLSHCFRDACDAAGEKTLTLASGAGHDAVMMAKIAPTSMLFVRCRDGISHHPDEDVDAKDVSAALKILIHGIERISKNWNY